MKKALVEMSRDPATRKILREWPCGPGNTIGEIKRLTDGRWAQIYKGKPIQIFEADEIEERVVLNGIERAQRKLK